MLLRATIKGRLFTKLDIIKNWLAACADSSYKILLYGIRQGSFYGSCNHLVEIAKGVEGLCLCVCSQWFD